MDTNYVILLYKNIIFTDNPTNYQFKILIIRLYFEEIHVENYYFEIQVERTSAS